MSLPRKIALLTYFHMQARYRRALAGFFWVIANPILTFIIQAIIFKSILKIEIPNFGMFLMSGLLPWFFISQSLYVVTNALVSSREVLLGFKIHPLIIVSSQVMDQFISFLAAFLLLCLFVLQGSLTSVFFTQLSLTFISTVILCFFVLTLTNLAAFWHVFYRDIQFIVQFVMSLAFYLTPIIYQKQFLPEQYHWLIDLNFFYPFIELFHHSIYELNLELWRQNSFRCLVTSVSAVFLLHLSYKLKMKEFYINV